MVDMSCSVVETEHFCDALEIGDMKSVVNVCSDSRTILALQTRSNQNWAEKYAIQLLFLFVGYLIIHQLSRLQNYSRLDVSGPDKGFILKY